MFGDTKMAKACLADFKIDIEIYRELQSEENKSTDLKKRIHRRCLQKVSAQQLVQACEDPEINFTPAHRFQALLRKRHSGIFVTQACEDVIGQQKNDRKMMAGKRFRKAEWSMAASVAAEVLSSRDKFDASSWDSAMHPKTSRLLLQAFRPLTADRSLPFQEIEGRQQATSWYSPSATNSTAPCGDLVALRWFKQIKMSFQLMEKLFLGQLVAVSHHVVFKRSVDNDTCWVYGLGSLDDSVAVVWPCEKNR